MTRRYHFQITTAAYVLLAALVGVAAANRPNNLLVWVFGLMLAAVLLSGLVSGLMLMGLQIVRLDPRRARVGEPMAVRYALRNRNRFVPTFGLRIEERASVASGTAARKMSRKGVGKWFGSRFGNWFASRLGLGTAESKSTGASAWILHAGPGATVHGEAVIWPTRRGRLKLEEIRIVSGFPFGLLRKSITVRQPQEILVHPRTVLLRPSLLRAVRGRGRDGQRASGRVGVGAEYYGIRDYRPGDSMRQIAWRRSALRDDPLTIERTAPSPPRLRVVLDLRTPTAQLRVPAHGDPRELEETAISLAASVIRLAERHDYQVGLTILGLTPAEVAPVRHGHWHTERLMAALAAIDLDDERTDRLPLPLADAERVGIVVVAPDRSDPSVVGAAAGSALLLTAGQMADLAQDDPMSERDAEPVRRPPAAKGAAA